jgi:hypothetical protein
MARSSEIDDTVRGRDLRKMIPNYAAAPKFATFGAGWSGHQRQ